MNRTPLSCSTILHAAVVTVICIIFSFTPVQAASEDAQPSVAVVPFAMHAGDNLAYLRDGLRDMLASRLATNTGAVIVEFTEVDAQVKEPGAKLQPDVAQVLARALGADYVVAGSLTSIGGSVSIDARVFSGKAGTKAQNFYASAEKESETINAVNQISWDIAEKVFGKTRPADRPQFSAAQTAPAADPMAGFRTMHPDRALRQKGGSPAAAFGSAFIMNRGVTGALGFTKTQNFDFALRAMDVGDINNDGEPDLVLAGTDAIHVFLNKGNRLQELAPLPFSSAQKVHGVSITDLDMDGLGEIYVSANKEGTPISFAVELQGDSFSTLFEKAPFYTRVVNLPDTGPTLIGQRGWSYEEPVRPGIFRLLLNNATLETSGKLALPSEVNLFDFAMADLDGNGSVETIVLTGDNKLQVLAAEGRKMWQGSEHYGGTSRYIGELETARAGGVPQASREGDQPPDDIAGARVYIPGRIIVTDLDKDGLPEVIVNRNISTASRVLKYYKSYTGGEIHAFAWNGIGLGELWRTRKIDGFIIDYQLAHYKTAEGEAPVLHVGVVLQGGTLDFLTGKESTVLMFPLPSGSEE
jgi:TolB-like protein